MLQGDGHRFPQTPRRTSLVARSSRFGLTQTVQQYNYFSHMFFLRLLGNNVPVSTPLQEGIRNMSVLPLLARLWSEDQGQDIAEYAVMLAVILVLVVGTVRMIGSNANGVFSQAASSIQ